MANDPYNPVRLDSKQAIAEARSRPGFTEAWDALEEEYAALSALLEARQKAQCHGWNRPSEMINIPHHLRR